MSAGALLTLAALAPATTGRRSHGSPGSPPTERSQWSTDASLAATSTGYRRRADGRRSRRDVHAATGPQLAKPPLARIVAVGLLLTVGLSVATALASSVRNLRAMQRRTCAVRAAGLLLILGTVAPLGCDDDRPAIDPDARGAVKTVKRALKFDSEFEGRRICRRVFTQGFMEEVSGIGNNRSAVIVCRLTRLSRMRRGRVVAARRNGNRVRVTIGQGGSRGTAVVIATPEGWRVRAATGISPFRRSSAGGSSSTVATMPSSPSCGPRSPPPTARTSNCSGVRCPR
jgi:hypothetical protein